MPQIGISKSFDVRSAEEIKRLVSRKRKRKSAKKGATNEDDHEEVDESNITNEIVAYTTIRASAKVRSIDWDTTVSSTFVQVITLLNLSLTSASRISRHEYNPAV